MREAGVVPVVEPPAQTTQGVEDLDLVIGVVGGDEEVDVDRPSVIVRRRDAEFDVGNDEVDIWYTAFVFPELFESRIVRDRAVVGHSQHLDCCLSFDRGEEFVPRPELVVEGGVGGVDV